MPPWLVPCWLWGLCCRWPACHGRDQRPISQQGYGRPENLYLYPYAACQYQVLRKHEAHVQNAMAASEAGFVCMPMLGWSTGLSLARWLGRTHTCVGSCPGFCWVLIAADAWAAAGPLLAAALPVATLRSAGVTMLSMGCLSECALEDSSASTTHR